MRQGRRQGWHGRPFQAVEALARRGRGGRRGGCCRRGAAGRRDGGAARCVARRGASGRAGGAAAGGRAGRARAARRDRRPLPGGGRGVADSARRAPRVGASDVRRGGEVPRPHLCSGARRLLPRRGRGGGGGGGVASGGVSDVAARRDARRAAAAGRGTPPRGLRADGAVGRGGAGRRARRCRAKCAAAHPGERLQPHRQPLRRARHVEGGDRDAGVVRAADRGRAARRGLLTLHAARRQEGGAEDGAGAAAARLGLRPHGGVAGHHPHLQPAPRRAGGVQLLLDTRRDAERTGEGEPPVTHLARARRRRVGLGLGGGGRRRRRRTACFRRGVSEEGGLWRAKSCLPQWVRSRRMSSARDCGSERTTLNRSPPER
mmetsp:Transcript_34733/g.116054  ORF Transcript_34733/g.116054 Transcript_34733/m.116054 type:complete len:375 (-) Transcript_34733:181-1305(-)